MRCYAFRRNSVSLKILLTGKTGQVGTDLQAVLPNLGEVLAVDRTQTDLANVAAIRALVRDTRPTVIVNAAAYTAVDKAETDAEVAAQINAIAPAVLAEEALRLNAVLIHYSTDYVFDGNKPSAYTEDDEPNPLNVYGLTKLQGEQAIQAVGCRHLILRTSWIYSHLGSNFLLTILKLAKQRRQLRVVNDQVGAPTSSAVVARATQQLIGAFANEQIPQGVYHMASSGAVSWFGFANAFLRQLGYWTELIPVSSMEYPSRARRPLNSTLDTSKITSHGICLPSWQESLSEVIERLQKVHEA
jgi:dTDP-4-dehydrorhamnose reductase